MSIKIQKDVNLNRFTTFRLGGKAEYYTEVENPEQLVEAVRYAKEKKLPIFVLGGGSNLLINDEGIKGFVIRNTNSDIEFIDDEKHTLVNAGSGAVWDKVVEESVKRGLQGIECLSGIPGSTGAAPIQNIGAYGQELKDTFVELTAYDLEEDNLVKYSKEECEFGYRDSIFKRPENKGRYLIIDLTLKLNKNKKPTLEYQSLIQYLEDKKINNPTIQQVRDAVLDLRSVKLEDPSIIGNAGSFFKNPIVDESVIKSLKDSYPDVPNYKVDGDKYKLFAGWLIDKAGWKGKSLGNAKVSQKNALVITNTGGATAKDVKNLAVAIQEDINKKFGVYLEPEVNIL